MLTLPEPAGEYNVMPVDRAPHMHMYIYRTHAVVAEYNKYKDT